MEDSSTVQVLHSLGDVRRQTQSQSPRHLHGPVINEAVQASAIHKLQNITCHFEPCTGNTFTSVQFVMRRPNEDEQFLEIHFILVFLSPYCKFLIKGKELIFV